MRHFIWLIVCTALFASSAWAEITYVDANPDPADGAVNVLVEDGPDEGDEGEPIVNDINLSLNRGTETDADGIWQERPRTTNNGKSVLVSVAGIDATDDGNNVIWTSTPTLPAGTYQVYVFFWINNNGAGAWDCLAKVGKWTSLDSTCLYTKDNATNLVGKTQLDGYDLPASLVKDDAAQDLFGVSVGQVVLESDGPITVSTAGLERTGEDRTWFDGIGYQLVEPCADVPDAVVQGPIAPGSTTVSVSGIDPAAQSVNVYVNSFTLIGTAAGSPPNTPATMDINVGALGLNDVVSARQVIGGVERCGPASQVTVSLAPPTPHITYVDADANTSGADGNTTIDGQLVDFTAGTGNATTGTGTDANNDGKWHYRTTYGNGGEVWETMDEVTTPAPLLTTLDLAPGTYRLYGLFWAGSNGAAPWDAGFRVGATGQFVNFAIGNVIVSSASGSEFVNSTMTREGDRFLMIAPLGEYTVNGPMEIYVLGPSRGVTGERSFFDGFGYELVSEPTGPLQVTDSFGDGDRNNDGQLDGGAAEDAADVGLEWVKVLANQAAPAFPASYTLQVAHDAEGLGDDNALHVTVTEPQAIQVAKFQSTALANAGDFVRLTFKVRLTGVVDFGDTFRFGLFNDNCTSVSLDQPTPAVLDDDFGYLVAMATGADAGDSHVAGNMAGGNLGSVLGEDDVFAPDDVFSEVINDTNPHTLSLTIARGVSGGALLKVYVDGVLATTVLDSTLPVLSFNEVALGTTPVKAISYIIDDVVVESGTTTELCETFPPGTIQPIIPAGSTEVTVTGILPTAESVNVYLGTTLIGSALGNPPRTPASLIVTVPPLSLNDALTARQVVNGLESCMPTEEAIVGACAAVPGAWLADGVRSGSTSVTVSGIDAAATAVTVYANGTTVLGTTTLASPAPASTTVTVSPLMDGDRVMATQTINGVEGCILMPGAPVLKAKINFIDAVANVSGTDGNTTVNGALVSTAAGGNATTSTTGQTGAQMTDGLWHLRQRATVNGGVVWETDVPNQEDTSPLVMTITLTPGTYDLYGLFWNNYNNRGVWDILFRVGATGDFVRFDHNNAAIATVAGSEFVNPTITRDGTDAQVLMVAPLGRFEVTAPVEIYVNASDDGLPNDDRTWFEGIGYALPCGDPGFDIDGDLDVDMADFGAFQRCITTGAAAPGGLGVCQCFDSDGNGSIDDLDFQALMGCGSGAGVPADPACDD